MAGPTSRGWWLRGGRRSFAAAILLLLAGCAAAPPPPSEIADLPKLRPEPVVVRHVVRFATDSDRLTAGERTALKAFLEGLGSIEPRLVVLHGGADPRAGRTYNDDLAARRARTVAAFLRQSGWSRVEVASRALGEAAARQSPAAWKDDRRVEVVAVVVRPTVVGCELPPARGGAHLGCAVQRALAASLAAPADLWRPQTLGPSSGVREALAVERYRRGELPPLSQPEKTP